MQTKPFVNAANVLSGPNPELKSLVDAIAKLCLENEVAKSTILALPQQTIPRQTEFSRACEDVRLQASISVAFQEFLQFSTGDVPPLLLPILRGLKTALDKTLEQSAVRISEGRAF